MPRAPKTNTALSTTEYIVRAKHKHMPEDWRAVCAQPGMPGEHIGAPASRMTRSGIGEAQKTIHNTRILW